LYAFCCFSFKSLAAARRNVSPPPREFTWIERRYFIGYFLVKDAAFFIRRSPARGWFRELWIDFFAALESFPN
jgi:hypothetical protein